MMIYCGKVDKLFNKNLRFYFSTSLFYLLTIDVNIFLLIYNDL